VTIDLVDIRLLTTNEKKFLVNLSHPLILDLLETGASPLMVQ